MTRKNPTLFIVVVALFGVWGNAASAEEPQIKVTPVAGSVHMLVGQGGNIGVSSGEDGMFMIDDQFAPLTEAIGRALEGIGEGPLRFVLNTHWHSDHTGGNENLGEAGVVIVAHDNVRERLSTDQFMKKFDKKIPAHPKAALPVITFSDTTTFHLNGDEIHVIHVPKAHTDGDSLVHFRKADVIHMGDTFFNGLYPFIDVGSGGSVDGMIAAVEAALALAGAKTKVIPGHGPLTDKAGLQEYRDMLTGSRAKVSALKKAGKSLDEAKVAKPTADWDGKWGKGFIPPDEFVQTIYEDLK